MYIGSEKWDAIEELLVEEWHDMHMSKESLWLLYWG